MSGMGRFYFTMLSIDYHHDTSFVLHLTMYQSGKDTRGKLSFGKWSPCNECVGRQRRVFDGSSIPTIGNWV